MPPTEGPDEDKPGSSPEGIPYVDDASQLMREIESWMPPEEPNPIAFVPSDIGEATVPKYSSPPFVLTDDGLVVLNSTPSPLQLLTTPPSTPIRTQRVSPVNSLDLPETPSFDLFLIAPQCKESPAPLASASVSSMDHPSGLPTPYSTPTAKRSETC